MKIAPTLEGGLRIDPESPIDWMVLRCIPYDARGRGADLAGHLAAALKGDPQAADWDEFVLPDLRDQFDRQLTLVEGALAQADDVETGGQVFILREDGEQWYGALNQARLALEERYSFSETDPVSMTPGVRSAWFRSQFYLNLQAMLLEHVMR